MRDLQTTEAGSADADERFFQDGVGREWTVFESAANDRPRLWLDPPEAFRRVRAVPPSWTN